ncbi:hypothetical protein AB0A74_26380 [Saccharothrix sp. NPDC042600]|uniref:hypothetical protein n=1 Tax=Saccharothrix TaxID=2071 RepID=UPI0033D2C6E8|nr:hypothetical protein GCM10017745_46120 [Saccharothrix mutabilis subsp. capreolus]
MRHHATPTDRSTPKAHTGIGRAFARFWAGDTEGAAFTITPRIEALARNLLVESDAGIYRVQRNQAPGQYPGLRFLLDKLLALEWIPRGTGSSWCSAPIQSA